MRSVAIGLGALFASACSTVTITRVDRCTVQQTKSWAGSMRSDIVFCDRDTPRWSDDRTLRLTQECLYEADLHRRDVLIQSSRAGHMGSPMVSDDDAFSQCYPDTVKSIQSENEALKDRLSREDETRTKLDGQRDKFTAELTSQRERLESRLNDQRQRLESQLDNQRDRIDQQIEGQRSRMDQERGLLESQMEGQHERIETALVSAQGQLNTALIGQSGKLQDALAHALDRPVNATAEARSTSDSGADTAVKHNSDSKELAHFDYASSQAQPPQTTIVHHVRPRAKPSTGKVCVTPPAPTAPTATDAKSTSGN